jgi:glycerol-3-phosphate dehydrogenase
VTEADLLIVGGGVNGAGIARDAARRRLSVVLAEQDGLATHTSSASSKLIHGGLRYLEYAELRLVREALSERERLLGIGLHIIRRLELVLPHAPHLRPAWVIRVGLFLHDHLGGRRRLPASRGLSFAGHPAGRVLRPEYRRTAVAGRHQRNWDCALSGRASGLCSRSHGFVRDLRQHSPRSPAGRSIPASRYPLATSA